MTAVPLPEQRTARSPFSEVRDTRHEATLALIATSAVIACSTLVAAVLVAVGFSA
ncbi:hypothetical protein ACPEEZ_14700 [Frigoribacterium sp. 2-23]|uniref:hypothetical protein n=1 Tax=Frigoribacterium sp. 2-23 TaxID=3415006 RepID=UPI003C70347B